VSRSERSGRVQTVLGTVDPEDLGPTLTHEHLLLDMRCWYVEPTSAEDKALAQESVSLGNLGWVRYHYSSSLDNLRLEDEAVAVAEMRRYKRAGGCALVELTSIGLGRSPLGLARISQASGVHVIMGTGYYVTNLAGTCDGNDLDEDQIVAHIVQDIEMGDAETGIRAGIIGEVGAEWPLREADRTSLRAAARAQRETGAALSVHPGRSPQAPFEILDLLAAEGVDPTRIVMGHVDRTLFEHDTRVELARRGCYLSYDQFSIEGWSPFRMVRSESGREPMRMPIDAERVEQIAALVEEGFIGQLLLSHDHCHKHRLWKYGGPGYGHILTNIVPLLRGCGLDEQEISTILIRNPQRLLRFD